MHFAPLLIENLPLTPHFAPPFGQFTNLHCQYVEILTSNLILRPLFDLRPGAATLPCPLVTPHETGTKMEILVPG